MSLQPPPDPPVALHVLDARPATIDAVAQRNLVLEVTPTRPWPGVDTPQMAYVKRPHQIDYYAYHRWADTPARMLGPLLARALEQSNAFRAVVPPGSAVVPDLRVVSELVVLQQDFTTLPSRSTIVLRVQLVDVGARRVLATRTFEATEIARSDDAYGGAVAANVALGRLLADVTAFCVTEARAARGAGG